nr:MAG TPA: hypothetical protein [Caudoviricetes sp.]
MGYWSYPQGFPQAGRDGQTFGVFAAGWGRGSGPHHINCVVCVSFVPFPVLFCDAGPTLRDPLRVWGPLFVRLVLLPWFF